MHSDELLLTHVWQVKQDKPTVLLRVLTRPSFGWMSESKSSQANKTPLLNILSVKKECCTLKSRQRQQKSGQRTISIFSLNVNANVGLSHLGEIIAVSS